MKNCQNSTEAVRLLIDQPTIVVINFLIYQELFHNDSNWPKTPKILSSFRNLTDSTKIVEVISIVCKSFS